MKAIESETSGDFESALKLTRESFHVEIPNFKLIFSTMHS